MAQPAAAAAALPNFNNIISNKFLFKCVFLVNHCSLLFVERGRGKIQKGVFINKFVITYEEILNVGKNNCSFFK